LGLEKEIKKRIDWWLKIKERIRAENAVSASAGSEPSREKKSGG
jgi:hypothetical protein